MPQRQEPKMDPTTVAILFVVVTTFPLVTGYLIAGFGGAVRAVLVSGLIAAYLWFLVSSDRFPFPKDLWLQVVMYAIPVGTLPVMWLTSGLPGK